MLVLYHAPECFNYTKVIIVIIIIIIIIILVILIIIILKIIVAATFWSLTLGKKCSLEIPIIHNDKI